MATHLDILAQTAASLLSVNFPDRVTFKRSTVTKGSAGGNVVADPVAINPQSVPVRYRPASGDEIVLAGKPLSGVVYILKIPSQFSDLLVDVKGTDLAVIAARGTEPERTLYVRWAGSRLGIQTQILASTEL